DLRNHHRLTTDPSPRRPPRHHTDHGPARTQQAGPTHTTNTGKTNDGIIGKINDGQQPRPPRTPPGRDAAPAAETAAPRPRDGPRSTKRTPPATRWRGPERRASTTAA